MVAKAWATRASNETSEITRDPATSLNRGRRVRELLSDHARLSRSSAHSDHSRRVGRLGEGINY